MSYMEALEALDKMVQQAKSVPLSASAVIPRADALQLIEDIKAALPAEHQQAREVMGERERILSQAHERASHIIEQAREERSHLLARAEVVQAAEREAKRIIEEAQTEAGTLRHQADDYVDAKLADFEVILDKMQRTLHRGREQLRKRLEAAEGEVSPLDLEDSGEFTGEFPTPEQDA